MTRLLLKFIFITTLLCLLGIGAGVVAGQGRETSRLLFARWIDNSAYLYVLDFESGVERQLTNEPTESFQFVRWSPDGHRIVYAIDGGLYVVDENGSNRRKLMDGTRFYCLTSQCWSPDGSHLLVQRQSALFIVEVSTGSVIVNVPNHLDNTIAWSPDGAYVLIDNFQGDHRVIDAESGETHWTFESQFSPQWSPTGQFLAYIEDRSDSGYLNILDIDSGVVHNISLEADFDYDSIIWSPTGDYIALFTTDSPVSDIFIMAVAGDVIHIERDVMLRGTHVTWMSDTQLLFTDNSYINGAALRWIDISGSGQIIVQDVSNRYYIPVLSPNQQYVVYPAIETIHGIPISDAIRVITIQGEQIWSFPFPPPVPDYTITYYFQWSPDGRHISFESNYPAPLTTYIIDLDNQQYYPLTDAYSIQWQPCCE